MGRSLSFRRRSNKADKAEPRYTTESDAAAPPAESDLPHLERLERIGLESATAEPAASSQKRVTSSSGAMRRTLSFGRRPSDALPRNWKRVTDADGHESYFNALTKETTLDRPKPLQRHWREAIDKSTGAVYYWNVRTRAVRWERRDVARDEAPEEALVKAPARSESSAPEWARDLLRAVWSASPSRCCQLRRRPHLRHLHWASPLWFGGPRYWARPPPPAASAATAAAATTSLEAS